MKTIPRMVYLIVFVLFTATACGAWASQPNADEIVQTVVAQIESQPVQQVEVQPAQQDETEPALYTPASTVTVSGEAESLQDTLVRLYEQVNSSVVYIIVSANASGSGFVYGADGTIVTNNHVVTAGDSYEVVFSSGDRQRARLVGRDADSDLAVLQVDQLPAGVEPLPLADAANLQVGQLVVAIGSPFGVEGSMSLGIISGLGRSLPSQRETAAQSTYSLPEVIQTDAPINPGNSGGPLLNLDGQVVGVNAAIASTTGTNSGVGFSIPVAAVKQVVPTLIEQGEYVYPYMGAAFDGEISLDEQSVYGISQTQGIYVTSVTPGGPAAQAGLIAADPETGRGGDLVIGLDGLPIHDFEDLNSYLVFRTQVGQTIQITVLRNGEQVVIPLTLGARP